MLWVVSSRQQHTHHSRGQSAPSEPQPAGRGRGLSRTTKRILTFTAVHTYCIHSWSRVFAKYSRGVRTVFARCSQVFASVRERSRRVQRASRTLFTLFASIHGWSHSFADVNPRSVRLSIVMCSTGTGTRLQVPRYKSEDGSERMGPTWAMSPVAALCYYKITYLLTSKKNLVGQACEVQ